MHQLQQRGKLPREPRQEEGPIGFVPNESLANSPHWGVRPSCACACSLGEREVRTAGSISREYAVHAAQVRVLAESRPFLALKHLRELAFLEEGERSGR